MRFSGGYPADLPRSAWNARAKGEYRALMKQLARKPKPGEPTALEAALRQAARQLREQEADRAPPLWLPSAVIA